VRLAIVPAALLELQDASDFYMSHANLELAEAFIDEFDRVTRLLMANPNLGIVWRNGRRRYCLRRFPYCVIYQVTATDLRVIAVAHQRRRPTYWRSRN
jgi:plasmid stabilization system protein ParE